MLWFFRLFFVFSFLEPKEKHCSGPLSRIKGVKTWKFLTEEKWKKKVSLDVTEWICVALVLWICVALVNSVVSVKGEEIL